MKYGLACMLFLMGVSSIFADRAAANSDEGDQSKVDALEYQLEIRRHESLVRQKQNHQHQLNGFTTDGCSGGLSVGWQYLAEAIESFQQLHGRKPPWEQCCIDHDRYYHAAGGRLISADQSFSLRLQADRQLEQCVEQTAFKRLSELSGAYDMSKEEVGQLYTVISRLMYRAVRIGGVPCTGLPWRWGYGWPECE